MRTSGICHALLCASLLSTACKDTVDGKEWDLASEDAGGDVTLEDGGGGDARRDAAPTDTGRDVAADLGTDAGADTSTVDSGADGGTDAGADIGTDAGGATTATGWFSSAFEHSGFIADGPNGSPVTVDEGNCSPYLTAAPPAENWWATGAPLNEARSVVTGGGMLSRMELTGDLTPPGMYGHLGAYDREFTVTEGSVLPCETADAAGHCVYPAARDLCVIPSVSVVSPDSEGEPYLTETFGGPAGSPTNYDLRITYDKNVADGRTDVVIDWSVGTTADARLELNELESVSLLVEQHGFVYREVPYENLQGWVARATTGINAWMVSITATSTEDASPLRVWGFFEVDETIALP